MKMKTITKMVSKTVEGDDEWFKVACTVEGSVDEDDDPHDAGDEIYKFAKHQVDKDLLKREAELDCNKDLYERIIGDNGADDDE